MGVYLSSPNKDKDTELGASKNTKIKFVTCGMQGWRVNMEDAHIADVDIDNKNLHIFGVFDGHGGKEVAKFAERHFVKELLKNGNFQQRNYKEALRETFLRIDELLQTPEGRKELNQITDGEGAGDGEVVSMAGCTANVSLLVDKMLYCANAGDSRSVLCLKGGQAVEMSQDHKPEMDGEYKRITAAGGYVVDGRVNGNLNLSRALGDLEYKKNKDKKVNEQLISAEPEVKERELTPSDEFLLLGCDGLFDQLSSQEVIDSVRKKLTEKNGDLKATVETFLDSILAPDTSMGVGCDNMSCIIVQLN